MQECVSRHQDMEIFLAIKVERECWQEGSASTIVPRRREVQSNGNGAAKVLEKCKHTTGSAGTMTLVFLVGLHVECQELQLQLLLVANI